ncbi:MAG: hypothetical protein VB050_18240 [Geobacteraceae bacterium]|nr:hypothetical protein [Geobacteraceae bacterium]
METMTLKTAEAMYDVKVKTLRLMCLRGQIESVRVGKHRYVTKAEMDRVFKGIEPESPREKKKPHRR